MPTIPILTTERLVLRPFREDDAAAAARILSTPRMVGQVATQQPYPVEAALSWIRQHNHWAEQGLHLQWAVALPHDSPIGMVSLDIGKDPPRGDLGYLIDSDHWNRGYATEAVRAVIACGLDVLHLPRIEAKCFALNAASIRVLEKSGLRRERLLPGYVDGGGQRHDILVYAVTRPIAANVT